MRNRKAIEKYGTALFRLGQRAVRACVKTVPRFLRDVRVVRVKVHILIVADKGGMM
jgi:hypothetical protein